MIETVLAIIGLSAAAGGAVVLGLWAQNSVEYLRWYRVWKKQKRIGLVQSAANGWNTSDIPENEVVVALTANWPPMIGFRRGDTFHSKGYSWPVENGIGWYPIPELPEGCEWSRF